MGYLLPFSSPSSSANGPTDVGEPDSFPHLEDDEILPLFRPFVPPADEVPARKGEQGNARKQGEQREEQDDHRPCPPFLSPNFS